MKNWKVLIGLLLSFSLIVAACGDDTTDTTEEAATETTEAAPTTTTEAAPTTTTEPAPEIAALVIGADETRVDVMTSVGAEFTAATGVPVEIVQINFDQGEIATSLDLGEAPDIFIGAHDWVGNLVASGFLAPIDLGEMAGDFFPYAIDAVTIDGTVYGLPYAVEQMALFYNTDLVSEVPATWDDLTAVCDALGDTVTSCLGVPAGNAFANYMFQTAFGGGIFAFDGGFDSSQVLVDSEGSIAGAEFIASLIDSGYLNPDLDWGTMEQLFNDGDEAFMLNGPWRIDAVVEAGVPFAVVAPPTIDGGQPEPFVGVQSFFVNGASENLLVAQTFLLDFAASAETQYSMFEAALRPPANTEAYAQALDHPTANVAALGPEEVDPQYLMPNIPEMGAVWGSWGNAIATIYSGEQTPADAMTGAAEEIRTTIAEG